MPEGSWLALSLPPSAGTGQKQSDLCSPAKVIPVQPYLRLPGRKERLKRKVVHLKDSIILALQQMEYSYSKDAARHSPDNQARPTSRHFPSWHPNPLCPQEGTEIVKTQGQTRETLLKQKGAGSDLIKHSAYHSCSTRRKHTYDNQHLCLSSVVTRAETATSWPGHHDVPHAAWRLVYSLTADLSCRTKKRLPL